MILFFGGGGGGGGGGGSYHDVQSHIDGNIIIMNNHYVMVGLDKGEAPSTPTLVSCRAATRLRWLSS